MHLLFLFLDGIGLGTDNPSINPFARVDMPNLQNLLGGKRLLAGAPIETQRATLLPLDACLGVSGLPQSASGQATLLTGVNVPSFLGYHYGPKPNPPLAEFLRNGNIFNTLIKKDKNAALVNAYPPRYFDAVNSGRRLYSAIPLAVTSAGISLKTSDDLHSGNAISADFTAQSWHTHLNLPDTPVISAEEAGARLAKLAVDHDFSMFEFWLSDYAGHHQDMSAACSLLETFDQVIGGLLDTWDDHSGLILITSDHGNLEDLSTRRHTFNPVPALLIGARELRSSFVRLAEDSAKRHSRGGSSQGSNPYSDEISLNLTNVAPAILGFLGEHHSQRSDLAISD